MFTATLALAVSIASFGSTLSALVSPGRALSAALVLGTSSCGAFCPVPTRMSVKPSTTSALNYISKGQHDAVDFPWSTPPPSKPIVFLETDDKLHRLAKWYWQHRGLLDLPVLVDGADKSMLHVYLQYDEIDVSKIRYTRFSDSLSRYGEWRALAETDEVAHASLIAADVAAHHDLDKAAQLLFRVESLDHTVGFWDALQGKQAVFNDLADQEVLRVRQKGYFASSMFEDQEEFN